MRIVRIVSWLVPHIMARRHDRAYTASVGWSRAADRPDGEGVPSECSADIGLIPYSQKTPPKTKHCSCRLPVVVSEQSTQPLTARDLAVIVHTRFGLCQPLIAHPLVESLSVVEFDVLADHPA